MIISKKKHLREVGKLKEEIMNLNLKLNELLKNEEELISDKEFYKAKYNEIIAYADSLEKKDNKVKSMLKKNDRVAYKDRMTYLEGKTISDPYVLISEKRKYIDVYFDDKDLQVPIPIDLLEKID